VDSYLGRLLDGLERRGLHDDVNIVIASDHGLSETSVDRVVALDDYIDLDDVDIIDINPTVGLLPRPGRQEVVYSALANAHPRLRVYRKHESPTHWHYRDHPRVPAIVGVVDEGWEVLRRATLADRIVRRLFGPRGAHGYDPRDATSMHGVFVAAGPAFKRGVSVPPFENVSVYNVLAAVLGVEPAPNDGDPALVKSLLQQ
jgi:predicted AlkP superfamily pyrophosphatase or phosphodiesterase